MLSAILWTFIKLSFVIKIIVLPIFEWPGFTVYQLHKQAQLRVKRILTIWLGDIKSASQYYHTLNEKRRVINFISQHMKFRYVSHCPAMKPQGSLHIHTHAVSPKPSALEHKNMEEEEDSNQNLRPRAPLYKSEWVFKGGFS